ncbi:MAG: ROK family protein [Candidatus Zhuqueibacterota bacterium]
MNDRFAIALDVGGSSVKSAIVAESGDILHGSVNRTTIHSKGEFQHIIDSFIHVLDNAFHLATERQVAIAGIAIGMPGPFDYANGVSLIKGVDKYEAIYGVNLTEIFRAGLNLTPEFPIMFENDAWAFVLGEAWIGAGRDFNRIIGLTLGTGMGSGFIANGDIVASGPGIPALAWIGGRKYKDGILDDRISSRGIIGTYLKLLRSEEKNVTVKLIAERADAGDVPALTAFEETGQIMGHMLVWHVRNFQAECLVIGGQIAQSFHLFGPALQQVFANEKLPTVIKPAVHIETSAMLGASRLLFKRISQ